MPRMIVARMIFPLTVQHRSKEIGSLGFGSGSENSIRRLLAFVYGKLFFLRKRKGFKLVLEYWGRRTCGYWELVKVSHLIISDF